MKTVKQYREYLSSLRSTLAYWKRYSTLGFTTSLYGLMKQRGVSQKKLATTLGLTPARVSQVLNAGENLTVETMAKLALALGAKVDIQVVPIGAAPIATHSSSEEAVRTVAAEKSEAIAAGVWMEAAPNAPAGETLSIVN